jgi:SpoVK/Ycf46/Vps4 family AAA+-type ATPase
VSFDTAIPWSDLAKLKLTGGEIVAIAREAAIYAIAESPSTKLGMAHILQALERIKP